MEYISEDLLNKQITIPFYDLINFYSINKDGDSIKYPLYKFINFTDNNDGTYSLTIVRKDNLDDYFRNEQKYKIEYEDTLESERIIRYELRDEMKQKGNFFTKDYDMANYHYIYFNTNKELLPDEDKYIIENIILKYSYPSCMNANYDITPDEQQEIINDEFNFIKQKLNIFNNNIILIQVPVLIYSMFNIYIQYTAKLIYNIDIIALSVDQVAYDYKLYCDIISDSYNINYISSINNRLIFLLYNIYKRTNIINIDYWLMVLDEIITYIYSFTKWKYLLKENSILLPLHFGKDLRFTEERNNRILKETLMCELKNQGKNIIILYRGSESDIELPCQLDWKSDLEIRSYSYNTSLLNAVFYDITAYTLYYYKQNNNKYYYIVKKHFHNDGSDESDILWIPPIHPVLLINMYGELFHGRSKIPTTETKLGIKGLSGFVPDFLKSRLTCGEMLEKYDKCIKKFRFEIIDKYYNKYLKYKNKFIILRKQNEEFNLILENRKM